MLLILGVYFVKRAPQAVPKTGDISATLVMGDLACKIIDQLAALVDEVSG